MGLSRIAHLRSLGAELFAVIGFGFVAGAAAGSMAFGLIVHSLDVYPLLPPRAAFAWPRSTWVLVGLAWVVVIAFASVAVQVLADRAHPAQVLREE
jgi:putative ABC transport system permease protein